MQRLIIPLIACAVAGCASTIRKDAPTATVLGHKSLDDTAACLVKALDQLVYSVPGGMANQIRIIEPNKVYEIGPIRHPFDELYFVRAIALGASSTRMELQVNGAYVDQGIPATRRYEPALSQCS
jgi:hypothetical protein